MLKYKKLYWESYGNLKKLSLILILVVGATFLISCNKNNNNLNEKLAEKEINKLETKDLSIY